MTHGGLVDDGGGAVGDHTSLTCGLCLLVHQLICCNLLGFVGILLSGIKLHHVHQAAASACIDVQRWHAHALNSPANHSPVMFQCNMAGGKESPENGRHPLSLWQLRLRNPPLQPNCQALWLVKQLSEQPKSYLRHCSR